MKQHLDKWSLVLILATFPLVSGCYSETANPPATSATPAPAVVTAPPVVSTAPDPVVTMAPPPVDVSMAVAATIDQPLPSNINPAGPAASVIKLAQAGVGENVIQSYIANSTAPFNLGSDDIIYLRDLGVSDAVITAMIQRDQALGNVASAQPAYAAPSPTVIEQAPPATVVETAPADVNYTYFYDSLAPYGSWVEVEGYGRCFQPTVVSVNRSWQPYCDNGHWVYTDSGWYWVSDYSWGWATFHYGRWFRHPNRGWCWAPDSEWGPAWVSWRYNSDYCGWAPLPPTAHYRSGVGFTFRGRNVGVSFGFGLTPDCYTFVPTGRFSDRHPDHFRAPRNQETHIYNSTTVINNIVVGNNNTIVNRGLGTERIERATHETIRPIHIRANADRNPRGGRHEQFDAGGSTLIVNHPPLREHGPDAGRNAPQVGGSPRNTFGGDRDRNANDNNARSPIVRPPGDRGNNSPGNNNPSSSNQRDRGNDNSRVNNNPSGNNSNSGNNNPPPRGGNPSPFTPVGSNPSNPNSGGNSANNGNNPPRNNWTPPTASTAPTAPTTPRSPVVIGRQNSGRQQNSNNQQPAFTPAAPRAQIPVQNTPANPAGPIIVPRNQNLRGNQQNTPRYNSPRIETQISPPLPVSQREPTFPRDNKSAPNQNSAPSSGNQQQYAPQGGRSTPAAQSNGGQNSGGQNSGSRSGGQDRSNSDKDQRNQQNPRNQR